MLILIIVEKVNVHFFFLSFLDGLLVVVDLILNLEQLIRGRVSFEDNTELPAMGLPLLVTHQHDLVAG